MYTQKRIKILISYLSVLMYAVQGLIYNHDIILHVSDVLATDHALRLLAISMFTRLYIGG